MPEIPTWKARVFIYATIAGGIAAVIAAALQAHFGDFRLPVFALMIGFSSMFPIYFPRTKGKSGGVVITIASIFTFTAILVLGPAEATLLTLVEAAVGLWRTRRSYTTVHKVLFNVFNLAMVTYATGHLFYWLYGSSAPLDPLQPHDVRWLFLCVGFCSLFFFAFNTGSIGVVISLVSQNPLRTVWKDGLISAFLSNFAEASAAVVVFLNFKQTAPLALGIALPTAFVIYYAYKMNLTRIDEAQRHLEEVNELYHSTIEALAMAVDAKDQVTHGHIYRVQAMVLGLANHCGMNDEEDLNGLRAASLLHDIGKLAIPDYILNKPGTLTDAEMETMKAHASVGADILSSVPFPYPVIPFVRHHHEKWDGTGYPDGLNAEQIPLGARILAIVDCYDALRSDRPYRARLSRDAALDYIKSEAGKSYDPTVVDALVANIHELESLASSVAAPAAAPVSAPQIHDHGESINEIGNTVFHDIASAHREVQAIHEISRAVGRLLNVTETLTLLASKIQQLIHYDACAVSLVNSNNQQLECYHSSGTGADLLNGLRLRLGEGVTGWVAANHRALLNVSPAPDFKTEPYLQEQLKSCLAVPLVLDKDVVGVITLYSRLTQAFRPNHLRLLENIAQHAATAISNAIIFEETKEDAYTDLLTGLPNLRYFQVFAEQELVRAERASYPVTFIMMDLDNFKAVNDDFGHKTGDRVLIEIAHVLRNQLRKSDTCIRYGGDEFIGILPGVDRSASQRIVEKIQSAVDGHAIRLHDTRSLSVGISVGAASFPEDGQRLDQLLIQADQDMYRDKLSRNRDRNERGVVVPFERKAEYA